jgi:diguanylate cyclase (GGDEF)-like protein
MTKPTILVVDDESFFRKVFSDILAEEGRYHIETAASGVAALKRLETRNFDIILSDLVMPEISGLDLLRRTRNLIPPPEVILATSNASVEMAVKALKNGARDYLLKPCPPDQLKHIVRTCLEQRRLLDENCLLRDQIRLYQQGQILATQLDVSTLLHDSLHALLHELGTGRACAFFSEDGSVTMTTVNPQMTEPEARALSHALVPRIANMSRVCMLYGKDIADHEALPADLRSLWILPLKAEKDFRGAIILCNPAGADLPVDFPEGALSFLAEQIALGFRNACQYEGARGLIYTDDLTGLYNYRFLQVALAQEVRRAERYGLEFTVAFIDLDMFKGVNDRHGHLVGSDLLKQVAAQLKTCIRDADMLFRYGGDEFTALLIETGSEGAKIVSERFRKTVEDLEYVTDQGEICRLTATVGYATYPRHAKTQAELIDLADKAMYQGKLDRNVSRSADQISAN